MLETNTQPLVIKLNNANALPNLFTNEATGLQWLAKANAIHIPNVIAHGVVNNHAYLLITYIAAGTKHPNFWEIFGQQLATLHKVTNPTFGLPTNNYIGSLPQYNNSSTTNAATFYIENRLQPQFQMAAKLGYNFTNLTTFYQNIRTIIPNEPPALIHGDLWSGNYLVGPTGLPCLIDPAVAFAPREMDIAMMHLFGGFSNQLFTAYNQSFPLQHGWEQRLPLWQLYYLLVHLNLFGSSYLGSVNNIIKQYS